MGYHLTFEAYLPDGIHNHCPLFEHNRFNFVYKGSCAVYYHRKTLLQLLNEMESLNQLHKAVIADLCSVASLGEMQAMAIIKKHISTPVSMITSRREHILDLRRYYTHLRDFLSQMVEDPSSLVDGTAILFDDCPPIKDEIWDAIYEVLPEQEALLEQIVAILCASFLVACERQLFDFLHGQWS